MANFIEFLKTNLFHVAPLLVVGAFGLAIILERSRALVWAYPIRNSQRFYEKLRDLVMADRLAEAISYCDHHQGKPVAAIVREGLLRAHQPEVLIEDGLELAVSEAGQRISKRTQFLATIANVATLLGLFGTIAGLISSFEAVGGASAQERSAMLAAGISSAMNATMLGLGVAIPSMIAFAYLMNRTNRLHVEIEQAAVRAMDLIRQRYYVAEMESISGGGRPGPNNPFTKAG